jgi:hypothetical protein
LTAAGVAAGTAATIATVTSVVFQVSGVNNKINKAASKVFGEDLVKIANIAGMAYGAVNGGFSLEPAKNFLGIGEAAASGANVVDSVAGLNSVPELTDAAWMAEGAANTAAITEAAQGLQAAPSVFDKMELGSADAVGPVDAGTDMLTGGSAMQDNLQTASNSATQSAGASLDPYKVGGSEFGAAAQQQAAAADAAGSKYALTSNATTPSATQGIQAGATQGIRATTGQGYQLASGAQPQNVFSRMFDKIGDKTIAGVIQGAAAGYGSARQAAAAAEARKVNPSTLRGYTYKATA